MPLPHSWPHTHGPRIEDSGHARPTCAPTALNGHAHHVDLRSRIQDPYTHRYPHRTQWPCSSCGSKIQDPGSIYSPVPPPHSMTKLIMWTQDPGSRIQILTGAPTALNGHAHHVDPRSRIHILTGAPTALMATLIKWVSMLGVPAPGCGAVCAFERQVMDAPTAMQFLARAGEVMVVELAGAFPLTVSPPFPGGRGRGEEGGGHSVWGSWVSGCAWGGAGEL